MDIFSARLKWLREKKGYTQKEIAEKIGMTSSSYSKYEYGLREPNLETLAKFPGILGESIDFMLGVTDFDTQSNEYYIGLNDRISRMGLLSDHLLQLNKMSLEDKTNTENLKFMVELARSELKDFEQKVTDSRLKLLESLIQIPLLSQESKDLIERLKKE